MSGIGGILHRDRQHLNLQQITMMSEALAHRGPDGVTSYTSPHAGLIHCMLHNTPESLFESLPGKSENDHFVITWHGRIDNRQELKDRTGWKLPLDETTDSDLILAAFQKWKSACVHHLLGDFALAILDISKNSLFCARDHMGIKPFYYLLTDSVFAFSSEIKGLFHIPEFDPAPNEIRIADYLTCIITENSSTFYKNILRLPPGHTLEVTPEKSTCQMYWQPHPVPTSCRNGSEYQEQFYSIFNEAVQCRMRSTHPVGSLLSGGLDSSSIVCMAAGPLKKHLHGSLHTCSGVFDTVTECDERHYFQAILKTHTLVSHSIIADQINPGPAYDAAFARHDEPFSAPHFFMPDALLKAAGKTGVRTLLDGHDGDSAVSYGLGLFHELFVHGQWISLLREFLAIQNEPTLSQGAKFFMRLGIHSLFNTLPPFLQNRYYSRQIAENIRHLNTAFILKSNLKEHLLTPRLTPPRFSQREQHCHLRNISSPLQPVALEFMDLQSVSHGIESRYPFFDPRLISFCLALPARQKFSHGYNRHIVRASLSSLLPEIIKRRKSKTDFSPNLRHLFSTTANSWLRFHIDRFPQDVYYYINKEKLEEIQNSFRQQSSKTSILDMTYLLRCISLADWLANKQGAKHVSTQ